MKLDVVQGEKWYKETRRIADMSIASSMLERISPGGGDIAIPPDLWWMFANIVHYLETKLEEDNDVTITLGRIRARASSIMSDLGDLTPAWHDAKRIDALCSEILDT